MSASRQVYHNAQSVLYGRNTFAFEGADDLNLFIRHCLTKRQAAPISSIQLDHHDFDSGRMKEREWGSCDEDEEEVVQDKDDFRFARNVSTATAERLAGLKKLCYVIHKSPTPSLNHGISALRSDNLKSVRAIVKLESFEDSYDWHYAEQIEKAMMLKDHGTVISREDDASRETIEDEDEDEDDLLDEVHTAPVILKVLDRPRYCCSRKCRDFRDPTGEGSF